MRIKRFEATDRKTAFDLVKKELGENAVILADKTLNPGSPSQRFEVVAAMDYDVESITVPPAGQDAPDNGNNGHEVGGRKPKIYGYDRFPAKKTASPVSSARDQQASDSLHQAAKGNAEKINFEAHDLRIRFASLLRKNGSAPPVKTGTKVAEGETQPASFQKQRPDPKEVTRWRNQLIGQLQVAPPDIKKSAGPAILALIGPTGVGKTTTTAKIAAWYKLRSNCRVALLSMDCYRIGATDQLRTYGRIMQIPCEVALRRQDLAKSIARHQDCDLIIIDTAGGSPFDNRHIEELSSWFSGIDFLEPQLVVSATTKKEDVQQIIESYAPLGPTGLILTKLDETRAYATLCQQVAGADIPVSYLATGQRVPEDFFVAEKPFLEKLFKKGWAAVSEAENFFPRSGASNM